MAARTTTSAQGPGILGWGSVSTPGPRGYPAAQLLPGQGCSGSAGGRRDYAIVLAMTRLALRGKEVPGLQLADVAWRSGELTIRGKGGRVNILPRPR